jgi:WD40 repeat protein
MSDLQQRDNPYVGFRPFFASDSLYFFGRREQTMTLLDLLRVSRYVPVLGSSGSGKSSLVLAGVIPTLQGGFMVADRDSWCIGICRPGDAPLENVARALLQAVGAPADSDAVNAFADRMRHDRERPVLALLRERLSAHHNVLLLADQFEEIFAFRAAAGSELDDEPGIVVDEARAAERVRRREDAQTYASLLMALSVQQTVPVYVISTMRTDFLGDCDRFAGLPEVINKSGYLVPRLTRTQLRETIEGPARLAGVRVAPRLADFVLNDIGDRSDMLPIMQHAVHRTWEVWRARGMMGPLDLPHLQEAGGLQRALAMEADSAVAGLDDAMVGRLFKRLTRIDLNQRRVRRAARRSDLLAVANGDRGVVQGLLDRLSAEGTNFLFVSAEDNPDDPRYDLSHESLIRQWDRLRVWVDEEAALAEWYYDIARKAARAKQGLDYDEPSVKSITQAKQLLTSNTVTPAWATRYHDADASFEDVQAFVRSAASQQRRRRIAWRTVPVVLVLAALIALGKITKARTDALEAQRQFIELNQFTTFERLSVEDPTYAARLAGEFSPEQRASVRLQQVLQRVATSPLATAEIPGVGTFAVNGAGTRLAVAYLHGAVSVMAVNDTGAPLHRRVHPEGTPATMLAFLPHDGLLVAWLDGTIAHWDASGKELRHWRVDGSVRALALSSDSSDIAVLTDEDHLYAWALSDSAAPPTPVVRAVTAMAFNPRVPHALAFSRVISNEREDRAQLGSYDVNRRRIEFRRDAPESPVELLRFNHSGTVLYAGGLGSSLQRFPNTGRATTSPDFELVVSLEVSDDDRELLVGTPSGAVMRYSANTLTPIAAVTRHGDMASAVFGRAGWVLSAGEDNSLRWTPMDDSSSSVELRGHREAVSFGAIAARGDWLFSLDEAGFLRVWRGSELGPPEFVPPLLGAVTNLHLASGTGRVVVGFRTGRAMALSPQRMIRLPAKHVLVAAVSSDGTRAVLQGIDGDTRWLWDIDSDRAPMVLETGVPAEFTRAAFSGDGRTLITAREGGRVSVFDGRTGARLGLVTVDSTDQIRELAISHDGALWVTGMLGTVAVRRRDGTPVLTVEDTTTQELGDVAIAANGQRVLWWNARSGGTVHTLSGRTAGTRIPLELSVSGSVNGVALSPAGDRVALSLGSGRVVAHVIEDSVASVVLSLPFSSNMVKHLSFSRDGRQLLGTSRDGSVRVWTLASQLQDSSAVLTLNIVGRMPRWAMSRVAESWMGDDGAVHTAVMPAGERPRLQTWHLDTARMQQRMMVWRARCLDRGSLERLARIAQPDTPPARCAHDAEFAARDAEERQR